MSKTHAALLALAALGGGCASAGPPEPYSAIGVVHRSAPELDALVDPEARIEQLAEGFQWSEGPVWVPHGRYLLFSDVPANKIYRWSRADGLSVFLDPSASETAEPDAPGTNGLIRGPSDSIFAADHGGRALVQIDLNTKKKTPLATHYQGKRFNSPNDLVRASSGAVYFTDPPYGLEGLNESPLKELPYNGVFRLDPDGKVTLLHAGLSMPNGVILSPDEKILYVTNSDPERAVIMAFPLLADGTLGPARLFADMTPLAKEGLKGLPDGLAIDRQGNLFSTGPGGVHVLAPDGRRLGRIDTGTAVANAKFGEDGRTLFLTSHDRLARIRTRTTGLGF